MEFIPTNVLMALFRYFCQLAPLRARPIGAAVYLVLDMSRGGQRRKNWKNA